MAKTINIESINEAGKLVLELMHPTNYWRLRVDPTKCAEVPKELVRDVERLEVLLKKPEVGGALSLANPYPIKIGFFLSVSYAQCVCEMFKSKLRGNCWDRDVLPEDNEEMVYHCIKELERATETPCNAELVEKVTSEFGPERNPERNDYIWDQHMDGQTVKDIWEELKKQKKGWAPLPLQEGVRAVIDRRKKKLRR
jgi:hypothetical protein